MEAGGERALVTYHHGVLRRIGRFEVVGGRMTPVRRVAHPEKFAHACHI
ncbi:hypothetical protein C9F11_01945 [Streptomyces sp. YIM 121038]|nr:hypothetical protein [Streptomyces sp. YIM 121038]QCX74092.1 hypothetical protein C9F11_01945 [Streptomyces sp. YIM 121038]